MCNRQGKGQFKTINKSRVKNNNSRSTLGLFVCVCVNVCWLTAWWIIDIEMVWVWLNDVQWDGFNKKNAKNVILSLGGIMNIHDRWTERINADNTYICLSKNESHKSCSWLKARLFCEQLNFIVLCIVFFLFFLWVIVNGFFSFCE